MRDVNECLGIFSCRKGLSKKYDSDDQAETYPVLDMLANVKTKIIRFIPQVFIKLYCNPHTEFEATDALVNKRDSPSLLSMGLVIVGT